MIMRVWVCVSQPLPSNTVHAGLLLLFFFAAMPTCSLCVKSIMQVAYKIIHVRNYLAV